MNTMAGTQVLHVPYRGSAPAVTDVATGAVTMSFSSLAAALPLIQAGKIRAVAVTSRDRMPQLPDVAPLSEGARPGSLTMNCSIGSPCSARPAHRPRLLNA
jgi:tripartite-type tricarboxylate transporter receptor subunit TctC